MERLGVGRRSSPSAGAALIRRGQAWRLSPWGYLLFTGWAGLTAALIDARALVGLAAVELLFGLIWSRDSLRLLRRPRFWIFVLTGLALGPFLIGDPDVAWGPFGLSWHGWVAGLEMAGRAVTLTLAFGLGMAALSLSDVVAVFGRLGLRGLGFALSLAMNLLETLREMAMVTLQTLWLRGGARRPLTTLRLFLVTTIANTLRYGEEMVNAAAVRAFDPNARRPISLPLRRADLWLALVLIGCSLVLVLG